jgi:hypothetical protein
MRKVRYFSPGSYAPHYFSTVKDFLDHRKDMIEALIGKKLKRVKCGFDLDENEWFQELPVLLYIEDDIYAINNWKLDETALDKNIISGKEFIDWMGYYNPETLTLKSNSVIQDSDQSCFHLCWKTFSIKHASDRIIQKITPLVYDHSSSTCFSLYDSTVKYADTNVLDYFDTIYPNQIRGVDSSIPCQSIMGLCIRFKSWLIYIVNGLDKNSIEVKDIHVLN